MSDQTRNTTWRKNHAAIHEAYLALIPLHNRVPTLKEVQEWLLAYKKLKMSQNSISKHLQELKFVPEEHDLRILNDSVLIAIANHAIAGNSGMAKLWVQIFNPELLAQRFANADGSNLNSVMLIPTNNRDALPGMNVEPFTDVEWQELEDEVKQLAAGSDQ